MRLAWLVAALVLASLLAYFQYVALEHYLYWRYLWLDTFMHFLGGLALSSFLVAVLDKKRAIVFLVGMLTVAVGWELFELGINAEREANFGFDTALDLLMDAVGMSLGYLVARYTLWRSA